MSKNGKSKNNKTNNSKNSINENTNNEIEDNTHQENKNKIFKIEKKDNNEKEEEKIEVINLDTNNDAEGLSQSLQNLLLDENFASPVVVKKENKLITDYHYATFKNSYGENTCYINVILHLLYNMDDLVDFLITLYQIDESNKASENNTEKDKNKNNDGQNEEEKEKEEKIEEKETYDINEFLVSLGAIIDEYDKIINSENENDNSNDRRYKQKQKGKNKSKQVTVIKTLKMRKILEKISGNKFQLNTIADPVELFTFILDILSENLNEDTHKSFYLELVDEYKCVKENNNQINNKYDKDNFMYHIYIDEILKYIETDKIKIRDYKNKLFEFSYNSFILGNNKICDKCNSEMEHYLICKNYPDYLLINCVWRQSNPIVDDVMKIFFLMALKDDINNLFVYRNKSSKKYYYHLLGFILYSFTLSHYVIVKYNKEKDVFVLYDDEIVKEYNNFNELIDDITVEVLKTSGKAFFYPVMLIYTREEIYKYKTINYNRLNDKEYQNLINKCNEAIYEYQQNNEIKEEMKSNNYEKLLKEQKEIEKEIQKRKNAAERKAVKSQNKNQDKNEEVNIEIEDSETNNKIKNEENKENKESIIIEDEDIKIEKIDLTKKEKSNKNSKSKDKDKKSKSKSKKKDIKEKEEDKKQKNKEIENINIKLINSNKATKKKPKKDINEIIWGNQQDNKTYSESMHDTQKKQNNNPKNKYLGKKINNSNEQRNNYYQNNSNNYKSSKNKGKTFVKNSSKKFY